MMALLLAVWGLVAPAWAGHHVVREGETLEGIAEELLGSAARAEELRQLNQLAPDAPLIPGTVLDIPQTEATAEGLGAYITALQGSGTITRAGQRPEPLRLGMSLRDGAVVCTSADSFARLRLVRESDSTAHDDISLLPGTCLVVESTVSRASGRAALVRLESGEISVLGSDDQRGEVTVNSEDGVTTGEAGGFRVVREAAATRTEAIAGAVAVISGGQEVAVDVGFGSRTRAGQAPDAPAPSTVPSSSSGLPAERSCCARTSPGPRPPISWATAWRSPPRLILRAS